MIYHFVIWNYRSSIIVFLDNNCSNYEVPINSLRTYKRCVYYGIRIRQGTIFDEA